MRWLQGSRAQPLRPLEQLEPAAPEQPFDWIATGDDPQFLVCKGRLLPGWYMLEIGLKHPWTQASSQLYLDTGDGFDEAHCMPLSSPGGKIAKRLFQVPRRLRNLRFDPLDRPGPFSILHFRIAWLPPFFAQDRLLRRLIRHRYRTLAPSASALRQQLKQKAQQVHQHWLTVALDEYAQTFPSHHHPSRQAPQSYRNWLAQAEPRQPAPAQVQRLLAKLHCQPLISILLPTFNTAPDWLSACINSVRAQTYPDWQLCIADDGSTRTETKALLTRLSDADARIEVHFCARNHGIAAASNQALAAARGELTGFLDHDDCLAPHALYQVARAFSRHPNAYLFYSDEDKIDQTGERFEPHFKPDWNPDLALAQNYVNHLAVYRTRLLRKLGGLRSEVNGSQDHDLLLRAWRQIADPAAIVHIPRILYHWRAIEGSTATDPRHKPETSVAGLSSLRAHLATTHPEASAEPGPFPNSYRVRWALPPRRPLVSVLLPTRDRLDLLAPCVDAVLERTDYPALEMLIIDNDSRCQATLGYLEEVQQHPRVRVLDWPHPFNFSAIVNAAAAEASGELLLLLNNDVTPINADWLSELVSQALRPEIGCVGAKLLFPDERVQHAGVILGIGGVAGHAHKFFHRAEHGYFGRLQLTQNLSAVTAACLLVRRELFMQVGGFDAEHLPVSFNDVDFCLRVRDAGYRNLWTPYAELYHHESASRGADDSPAKQARFGAELAWMQRRWGRRLRLDPAYNPNLTLQHEDFSLR
ncbi:MAG: glycosyltransferase family 2 protein [Halochromatium sp.]|nr:glycosyltransferase family 2 protein [Halochromatium sp.]